MKKLAVIGLSGRMGCEILALATESSEFNFKVTAGVARRREGLGEVRVVSRPEELKSEDCDVVIDFSLPEATPSVLEYCLAAKKPLVSGVTGLSQVHHEQFARAAKSIALLWSPNMSIGLNALAKALSHLKGLKEFDLQIEEIHHTRKKDAPSGTALFLQAELEKAVGRDLPEPMAIRGGGIVGLHRVLAMGEEEILTFEHQALNRRVFARGALHAARWLVDRDPGLYKMGDVFA
jgi:4-hydroxy-tetrahydrodipicolinate reductase